MGYDLQEVVVEKVVKRTLSVMEATLGMLSALKLFDVDVLNAYTTKYNENIRRQDTGYVGAD